MEILSLRTIDLSEVSSKFQFVEQIGELYILKPRCEFGVIYPFLGKVYNLMKNKEKSWNHNYAYNRWIAKMIGNRNNILDVGCGDGTLALYLRTTDNDILGIDISDSSIQKANKKNIYRNVSFIQTPFEEFQANNESFDAIVFVASIHHMDMIKAIDKAKKLLAKNGVLIIVGLAKPSSLFDWIVELARIIPSKTISIIKKNITSEELEIDVSYDFPTMETVRQICKEKLCGYSLRFGLHYRYLLTWENN